MSAVLQTRGEKNCNPLNIDRTGIVWQGMAQEQTDLRFIVFVGPEYGYRAAARIIREHYADGRTTIRQIVNAWAPPVENETTAYVADVAQRMGNDPDEPLVIGRTVGDPSQLLGLLRSMTYHENGRCIYDDSVIQAGMDLEIPG
jgi:hypothetical protein